MQPDRYSGVKLVKCTAGGYRVIPLTPVERACKAVLWEFIDSAAHIRLLY